MCYVWLSLVKGSPLTSEYQTSQSEMKGLILTRLDLLDHSSLWGTVASDDPVRDRDE